MKKQPIVPDKIQCEYEEPGRGNIYKVITFDLTLSKDEINTIREYICSHPKSEFGAALQEALTIGISNLR